MINCLKCGKEALYFETEIWGNVHLCQDCDKKDIEIISKELLRLADSKDIDRE